jgi:glycosyltransferase involved in cell wall biosynthesis
MTFSLVLITTNYPYTHTGGEVMFVAPEMQRLALQINNICVVPQNPLGARLPTPPGVTVDLSLAKALKRQRGWALLAAWFWPGFLAEFWRGFRKGGWVGAVRVWRWAAAAHTTYQWAGKRFEPQDATLFYTYWRGGATLALARLAQMRSAAKVVTRAHRYELYENSFTPPFQPWHPTLYKQLTCAALVSQHGLDYLLNAGVPKKQLTLFRLGTEAPVCLARASIDGTLRFVSSSFVTPVKRVPLLAQCLLAWAQQNPQRPLHWTHFGDGPQLMQVKAVLKNSPAHFTFDLPGHVDNAVVMAHYATQPIDLFLLLSQSEGLPVSIQEAASAGVPVVATDVGGVAELVGSDVGALLPSSPTVAQVLSVLNAIFAIKNSEQLKAMRCAAHKRWQADFNAEHNHTLFARHLVRLMHTS